MAVTFSNPPWWTQVDDALLADRPLLVGEHLIFEQRSIIQPGFHGFWGDTSTYSASAPGGSGNRNPITSFDPMAINSYFRLFDKQHDLAFSPRLTVSEADIYLWGDIDPDDSKRVDIVVIGYNFVGISFDVAVRVSLMNYRDQGTVTGALASRTIAGTGPRQGLIYIALPNQYRDVGGYRIHFDPGASTFGPNAFPGVTELVIGRRCQLGVQPVRPYSLDRYEADVDQFFSESGQAWNVVRHVGRWEQDVVFELESRGNRYGWSDVDRVRELGIVTGGFSEPFAVFPSPNTEPARGHWTQAVPPALRLPETAPGRREWSMTWREIPPDYRVRATKVGQFVPSAGAAPWSPLDLSPVAWWDGTDSSNMNSAFDGTGSAPTSNGDNVARWVDRVGGVALVRSVGTPPTWNGSDGVVFAEAVADNLSGGAAFKANFLHSGAGGAAFMKVWTDDTGGQHVIFLTNGRSSGNVGMTLEVAGGQLRALVSAGSGWLTTATIGSVTEGLHDIVYSLDGTTVSIWIDGTEFTTSLSGAGSSSDHAGDFTIGDDGTRDVDGPIKQLVLLDRAATAGDVDNWGLWTP